MKRKVLSILLLFMTVYYASAQDTFTLPMQRQLEKMASELEAKLVTSPASLQTINVVKDFNADNKGRRTTTKQLQKAIDAAAKKAPCRVVFPAGTYVTGTLFLRSGVHIELMEGARILASVNLKDYPERYPEYKSNTDLQVNKSLFYAEKVSGISISGNGSIDFRGNDKLYEGSGGNDPLRPFGIRIISSKNIYIAGLHLKNSAQWMQHYLDCDSVMIENLDVFNHAHHNNDGMDIDGSRHVYVRNCNVDSDDDAICLKSNGIAACENILIENCTAASHCNSLKLGTETTGGFRNILYRNCRVVQSVTGKKYINGVPTTRTAITLIITDGGAMENIWFDNINATDCITPIFVTLGSRGRIHTPGAPKPGIGSMSNIKISNFNATGAGPISSMATGLSDKHRIHNFILEDISLEMSVPGKPEDKNADMDAIIKMAKPRYPSPHAWKSNLPSSGFYFRYIDGLALYNINMKYKNNDPRNKMIFKDCDSIVWD